MPRDSGGSYTLPNPPAVDGTVASAAWINGQLGDVAAGLSDSLSRSGQGGLLSALKYGDGSVSLPAITFTSEPASGLYRVAANILALVIAGAEKLRATLTGVAVTGTLGVTGAVTATGDVVVDSGGANSGIIGSNVLRFGAATGEGIGAKRTAGGNQYGLDFYTNSVVRMSITNGGAVTGLPAPAGASDAATKGYVDSVATAATAAADVASKSYVDSRFVVAGHVTGSTGAVASQTGTVTASCARNSTGNYTLTVPGLGSSGVLVVSTTNAGGTVTQTGTANLGGGTISVLTYIAGTSTVIDSDFSFVVAKL